MSYTCSQCGKTHEGLPTDRAFKLPDVVWSVPEAERPLRARWTTDLCETREGEFFIRCLLQLPFTRRAGYFGWGVWAKVHRTVFQRYVQLYDADATAEPQARGTLANSIPLYRDADGASVILTFGNASARPLLTVEGNSSLAADQRRGIDDRRYHEILRAAGITAA